MMKRMSTERITISLPSEVRQAALLVAQSAGVPLSTVVNEAITAWLRTRLVDAWLTDFESNHGAFDEAELQALAAETGVPYLPPRSRSSPA